MHAEFVTSIARIEQLPPPGDPEVAVVGRSNAGKSTLLNMLMQHKGLARTSQIPGRTQMINLFRVNRHRLLVDLPGYGFRIASKSITSGWQELMTAYFERPTIESLLFLVDIRRDWDRDDWNLVHYLSTKSPRFCVVLTKSDKLSRNEAQKQKSAFEKILKEKKVLHSGIFLTSSLNADSVANLRELIFAPSPTAEATTSENSNPRAD